MAPKRPVIVRVVWEENVDFEFSLIRQYVKYFPFASIDTEFPGIIHPPPPFYHHNLEQTYNSMKENVNDTKIIQLGLTLTDSRGNLPGFDTNYSYIWEFNFREFDINDKDHQNEGSINLLKKQGIDFEKNMEKGIDSEHFATLFKKSGLLCACQWSPSGFRTFGDVTWITFHGLYDFGHLIKILNQRDLPNDVFEFMKEMRMYFGPAVYDMKQIVKYCEGLDGGLEKIAKRLGVRRVAGKIHQAGSDSLLTMQTFMKLIEMYFDCINFEWFSCRLYGLDLMEVDCMRAFKPVCNDY